jgi:hypothetical protein
MVAFAGAALLLAPSAYAKDPMFRSAGKFTLDMEKCAHVTCKVYPGPEGKEKEERICKRYTPKGKEFEFQGVTSVSKSGAFETVDCSQIILSE